METLTLNATNRTTIGRKNYAMRNEGLIPAVVYGSDIKPMNVAIESSVFTRTLRHAGESTIIDLNIEGEKAPLKVLIQDVQRDPVRTDVIHVDFRQVNMNKPIEAKIMLNFIGDSKAVDALGGTFIRSLEEIEVRCLPGKLVHFIDVDISALKSFEDSIHVRDIVVPEGMEIISDLEYTVAAVEAPRSDADIAALSEAVEGADLSKVEVEKKGKDEEAAAAAAEADKK